MSLTPEEEEEARLDAMFDQMSNMGKELSRSGVVLMEITRAYLDGKGTPDRTSEEIYTILHRLQVMSIIDFFLHILERSQKDKKDLDVLPIKPLMLAAFTSCARELDREERDFHTILRRYFPHETSTTPKHEPEVLNKGAKL